ncbi:MAG: hypothetical protein BWY52_03005 [Chloroflexi bacterium ADurb.Bin325]|nr:MAG: hypothetical protein BWY52_03005 [Chloroflexi bacterium ADurb.Bin325]
MKNADVEQQLIEYGRWLMAAADGRTSAPPPGWTESFVKLLSGQAAQAPAAGPLQSILTLATADGRTAPAAYVPPVALSLAPNDGEWGLLPIADLTAPRLRDRQELLAGFERETSGPLSFEHFFYLMRKYASTLPNSYGEPGVSLFEQWKTIAALVEISGSTEEIPTALGLVGGDIPGIQRTIDMVTAKGAAKAMRGRSAFIQLLGHALVQRLLDTLGLGPANVVYEAGGNFVLLTGWAEGEEGTARRVHAVANDVNRVLLGGAGADAERFDGFHGDLAVALAAVPLTEGLAALRYDLPPLTGPNGRQSSRWQQAEKRLKDAIAAAKRRPFGDLALGRDSDWDLLFETEPAETNDFCAVCRRQREKREPAFRPLDQEDVGPATGSNVVCPECWGFNDLANDLGHRAARLVLARVQPPQPRAWQHALHAVSDQWFSIEKTTAPRAAASDTVLVFDPDEFKTGITGFMWLSHTTPMADADNIRSNDELAEQSSSGFKRLGVLRMDVDNLGDRIVHGLPRRTPMQTAELSQALERFFAGWLDRICARVDGGRGLFYVLFAGGDDLFVVGPWDLMPLLAVEIREDFAKYAHHNPAFGISGGIAVVGAHEPLHRAGDEAHDALKEAKDRPGKDALTFLGHTHGWDAFRQVVALKDDILELAKDHGLANALITRLLAIARRYHRDRGRKPYGVRGAVPPRITDPIFYGPWMWQQTYALARLKEGRPAEVCSKLGALEKKILDDRQIVYLGLATRWAQWLSRKGA